MNMKSTWSLEAIGALNPASMATSFKSKLDMPCQTLPPQPSHPTPICHQSPGGAHPLTALSPIVIPTSRVLEPSLADWDHQHSGIFQKQRLLLYDNNMENRNVVFIRFLLIRLKRTHKQCTPHTCTHTLTVFLFCLTEKGPKQSIPTPIHRQGVPRCAPEGLCD